ncbi:unnamed protein product [Ectocarpus sp. 12 AP-2014]
MFRRAMCTGRPTWHGRVSILRWPATSPAKPSSAARRAATVPADVANASGSGDRSGGQPPPAADPAETIRLSKASCAAPAAAAPAPAAAAAAAAQPIQLREVLVVIVLHRQHALLGCQRLTRATRGASGATGPKIMRGKPAARGLSQNPVCHFASRRRLSAKRRRCWASCFLAGFQVPCTLRTWRTQAGSLRAWRLPLLRG